MRLVCIVAAAVAVVIFAQVLRIQYTDQEAQEVAEASMQRFIALEANRGNIYAEDGSLLATSLPYYKLAIDPTLPSSYLLDQYLGEFVDRLSTLFREHNASYYKRQILRARANSRKYLPLVQAEISHSDRKKILKWPLAKEGRLVGGVILDKVSRRFRPFGAIGIRTIGRLDKKQRGVTGLEYSFDQILGGEDGRVLVERSVGGKWHPLYDGSEIHSRSGDDIVTTLDVNIQEVAHHALLSALRRHKADFGCAVVMEVRTGEVKAMANFSRRSDGRFVSDYNYAVASQGVLEPGSTFKLATMLALLERSTLQLTDSIETGGGRYSFFGSLMRDTKEWGTLTAAEAFEYSSNIGVARLTVDHFGDRPEIYTSYLKNKLHLHQPLGFQLKGEGRSYVKTIADTSWSATSLAWISHGYELRIAPLQLLTIYNAVANDGRMMAPLLVKSIRRDDKIIEEFRTRVIEEEIARRETITQVQGLLEGVVLRGTASAIRSPYYRIAGKTGTAKQYNNGQYVDKYRASFVGYFPADDPQYSCLVVIGNPRVGGIHGAEVSAPVFRQISDRICRRGMRLSNLRMAKDVPLIGGGMKEEIQRLCDQLSIPYMPSGDHIWVRTLNAGGKVAFRSAVEPQKMPDLRGMLLRDALYIAENSGLKVRRKGRGPRVESQYPPPLRPIEKGTDVILALR